MPDWPSIVRSETVQRELESARAEQERAQLLGISLFFWIVQAAFATAGVALVLWQGYREWGALPPASGEGEGVYAFVAISVALLWGGALYAWYLWRQPM